MITSRRNFLKIGSLLTLGISLAPRAAWSKTQEKLRFGILSDTHYAEREPTKVRHYAESIQKLRQAVDVFNANELDFVVHLGDFKDEDKTPTPQNTIRYLQAIERVYAGFRGARYHCVGNHDIDSISKQMFLEHIENTGVPTDSSYYSFYASGRKFIVLDALYSKTGESYGNGKFTWHDANLPDEELKWFEQELKTDLPVVVFSHYTLFEFRRNGKQYHINNYKQAQQLMQQTGNVVAVFQGHVHEERHVYLNGIHYLSLPGMVDYSGLENNAFAVVEFAGDRITIEGFGRYTGETIAG